jgi:hypothetical protein
MQSYDRLIEKWSPVLNEESAGEIKDHHRRAVTAAVLENQEIAFRESAQINEVAANAAGNGVSTVDGGTGAASNWDPVLIALVRRAMPNLMAYDVCGVQPMTGPTGLIFAMKSRYKTSNAGAGAFDIAGGASGTEALFDEAEVVYSGDSSVTGNGDTGPSGLFDPTWNPDADNNSDITESAGSVAEGNASGANIPVTGGGMSTATAESLGNTGNSFHEMGFTIEKATVTAKSRALKAEYTLELAQDLKAIHGLDAETELANILSTEILAEINREVIRTINAQAKIGCRQPGLQTAGIFDLATDADGRWSVEKFKGMLVQLEREANVIAKETRRGKGNILICSSDVATALSASGMLDYAPALNTTLQVDDTGNTFAGVLNGRMRVYIDPYAVGDYAVIGYKGSNPYDSGVFYCPYVPLQMVRAVGENDFQPRIGFKTRYGMVSNPFVGANAADGLALNRTNQYYRIFRVDNILA